MSRWYEPIDRRPGVASVVRSAPGQITFELPIVGLRPEAPTPKPRVFLRCTDDGTITLRLLLGRSSAT